VAERLYVQVGHHSPTLRKGPLQNILLRL
jgi:hypothetical protein